MAIDHGNLSCTKSGHIAELEFSHPKANSLPKPLLEKLRREFEVLASDDNLRIIVLRSAGEGAFCAGASFDEFKQIVTLEQGHEFFQAIGRLLITMIRCPKLIVARVHGKAVGGGVGLLAATDYSFAVSGASAQLSELKLGIGPFTIGPLVSHKIGHAKFGAMTIDTQWRDADWCRAAGLYTQVGASIKEMDHSLGAFCADFANANCAAIKYIKEMIWSGSEHWPKLLDERAKISAELLLAEKKVG